MGAATSVPADSPVDVPLVAQYIDSGTQMGLPTQPEAFNAAVQYLSNLHPHLEIEVLVRDTHLLNALWCLSSRWPDGRVLIDPPARRRKQTQPHEVGTYIFTGGTALVTGHQMGERISDDLDVLFIPNPNYSGENAVQKNSRRVAKEAAPGVASRYKFRTFGQPTASCEYLLAARETFITMDVIPKRDFGAPHLDLIDVEMHPVVSLAGRHGSTELLARFPQLGGFEMPLAPPAYIAATKFDALHHRAKRGTKAALDQLSGRACDIYDLYSIATSDRADEVPARIPPLSAVTIHDFMNRCEHPRPPTGYANSPVFKDGTPADEALRRGVELLLPHIVWGHLPTYEEMREAACSLDPRRTF